MAKFRSSPKRRAMVERLRDRVREGARHSQIAAVAGVSERTVYNWFERSEGPRNPIVVDALERWLANGKAGAK